MNRLSDLTKNAWKTLRDSGPRGRMARSVLANFYDKAGITLIQILNIPILSRHWGADGYGTWLMLLTVPTYISLSDFGFGAAAGVRLTQAVAREDFDEAEAILQSTIAFVMGTVAVVGVAALAYAGWYAIFGEGSGPFSASDIALAIAFITGYALVITQMNIVTVAFRATHRFALATTFIGTWLLIEGSALMALALAGFGIVAASATLLAIRAAGYTIFVRLLRQGAPWARTGVRLAQWPLIAELARPSMAVLGLTFASAVMIQGMILAIGSTAGAAAVATFGAARTLSRVPLQLSGMFVRPSIPELTRAILEGNRGLERRLRLTNIWSAIISTVPYGLLLILSGPALLNWVTAGKFTGSTSLFGFLALAASANAIWSASAAPLVAMNRQSEFSYLYVGVSVLATSGVILFAPHRLVIPAAFGAIAEVVVLAWLSIISCRQLRLPKGSPS